MGKGQDKKKETKKKPAKSMAEKKSGEERKGQVARRAGFSVEAPSEDASHSKLLKDAT
ncbi:MAG: hypothetical protein Q8N04_03525 [Nitrospira sp.]|nr:hypothetical protein [Nitrospira sp.]